MKNILYLSVFLFILTTVSCQQERKVRTLTITVDESINSQSQWLYWFYFYGNEYSIIDSCYIEKGQTTLVLHDSIMNDSIATTELVLSEIVLPWENAMFRIDSKDRDIKIHNLTAKGIYANGCTISGALAEEEDRQIFEKSKKYKKRLQELDDNLWSTDYNDTITISKITKETEHIKNYLECDFILNQLDSVQSTTTVSNLLMSLGNSIRFGKVSKSTTDSITQVLSERYPNDTKITTAINQYIQGKRTPPQSEKSKYWIERKDKIRFLAHNKQKMIKNDGSSALPQEQTRPSGIYAVEKDTTNIPSYVIGSKIVSLKLRDQYGKLSSISDIKTDYILIDFWATWCAPCVREIPNIKEIHNRYKNKLSVYAISLDNTERQWKRGIEEYKCRQFNHVYAGSWAENDVRLLTNSFGVHSIPANFLLNKKREIIAINLRGEDLNKKMKELLD